MSGETITFQLATHYLPRIALRLENLFDTIEQACQETHPVIHHYALKNILEITNLIEKPELKSRFLKEFMRIEHALNKSKKVISNTLYADLFVQIQLLNQVAGDFGGSIHHDTFLQSVRATQNISQNDFELHSPQLILWLENEAEERQSNLQVWMNGLQNLYDTATVYLSLLRDTAEFAMINFRNGFYQRSLPCRTSCHLIILRMEKKTGVVPRMQLGNHGFSLRLCEANSMHEIRPTETTVDLAICQL